jgi:hypothetical protein
MKRCKAYYALAVNLPPKQPKRTVCKDLNADALIKLARKDFSQINDHRAGNSKISLPDAPTSALAMFHLKDRNRPIKSIFSSCARGGILVAS